jgi:hypothetical protein
VQELRETEKYLKALDLWTTIGYCRQLADNLKTLLNFLS